jgi:hypothetical protein
MRERFGDSFVILRDDAAHEAFETAVELFNRGHISKALLQEKLIALGAAAEQIRRVIAGERLALISG